MKQLLSLVLLLCSSLGVYAGITHTFSFDSPNITDTIMADGQQASKISINGLDEYNNAGMPLLPCKSVLVSVPYNADNFRILSNSNDCVTLNLDYPIALGDATIDGYIPEGFSCDIPEIYPDVRAEMEDVLIYDGIHKLVRINVYPMSYLTNGNVVTFNSEISINLDWDISENCFMLPNSDIVGSANKIKDEVLNSDDILNNAPQEMVLTSDPEDREYIIITTNELAPYFRRLINLRQLKGYRTDLYTIEYILSHPVCRNGDTATGVNDDAGKLREFLKYIYGRTVAKNILLAGTADRIPTRQGYRGSFKPENLMDTDLYFSEFYSNWDRNSDGKLGGASDQLNYSPTVYVGRIPFETPEDVINYTNKLYIYELNPGNGNASYLSRSAYTHCNSLKSGITSTDLRGYFSVYKKIFNLAQKDTWPDGAEVIHALGNIKCGNYNFVGHGNPGGVSVKDTTDINNRKISTGILALEGEHCGLVEETGNGLNNLENNKYYPSWSYSISCSLMPFKRTFTEMSGWSYDVIKTFGESYILGKDYGGVAFLGNTAQSWTSDGSKAIYYFFNDLLTAYSSSSYERGVCAGEMMARMRALTNDISRDERIMHNLYGDPLVPLWIKAPKKIEVYDQISAKYDDRYVEFLNTDAVEPFICDTPIDNPLLRSTYQVSWEELNTKTRYEDNHIYTIYGRDYLPKTLTTIVQNFDFKAAMSYNYLVDELKMGKSVNPCTKSGDVVLQNNSDVNFEALGDVYIYHGTVFEQNSKLKITSAKSVTLYGFTLPSGSTLDISAPEINLYGNVIFETGSTVILNGKVNRPINKPRMKDDTYQPMVVEGRTWWYLVIRPYVGMETYSKEYGIRICGTETIDGIEWHKIKIVMQSKWIDSKPDITIYDDSEYFLCYIREEDRKVYLRYRENDLLQERPLSDVLGWPSFFADYWDWEKELNGDEFIEMSLYDFEEGVIEGCWGIPGNGTIYTTEAGDVIKSGNHQYKGYNMIMQNYFQYTIYEVLGSIHDIFFMPRFDWRTSSISEYEERLLYVTDSDYNIIYDPSNGEWSKLWEDIAGETPRLSDDNESAPIEWYDMCGNKLQNPTKPGVYIRRQGGKVTKVAI